MPKFIYRIAQRDGSIIEDRADAEDEETLRYRLESKGHLVLNIKRHGLSTIKYAGIQPFYLRDFLVFNQELYTLLKAGIPLVQSLDILVGGTYNARFREILKEVVKDIRGGLSLTGAMARHPKYFSEIYVSSLKAGEQSGNLAEIIQRYIAYLKKVLTVKQKLITALAYPSFLLIVVFFVILFLLAYVMPTFSEIYRDYTTEIPYLTRMLMEVTVLLKDSFIFLFISIIAVVFILRSLYRKEKGRLFFDFLFLRFPVVGDIIGKYLIARLSRTLSVLLASGMPLLSSLDITSQAVPNRVVSLKVLEARNRVKEGSGLATAFDEKGVMPRMGVRMLEVGETTGSLEEMLNNIADLYEEGVEVKLARIMVLIEPVIMLTMGLIVGAIVVIMYLPIFNLAGAVK